MKRAVHTHSPASSWARVALMTLVVAVFSLEWVIPSTLWAQGPSNSSSVAAMSETLPPIQRTEEIAKPPFYKRWWFWTIVVAAVAGGVAVAASGGGGNGSSPSTAGTATVTGPALR